MAFTVRSLLSKVLPFRKDLEPEKAIFAIKEVVRKICRQTGFAQASVQTLGETNNFNINIFAPLATFGTPYRVHLVRVFDVNMINKNTIIPVTTYDDMGVPIANLSSGVKYKIVDMGTSTVWSNTSLGFNITTYPIGVGTEFADYIDPISPVDAGDGTVIIADNNVADAYYMNLSEGNQPFIDGNTAYATYPTGFPAGWTYTGGGNIHIYPTPDKPYNFLVTASFIPGGDFDDIPLPEESEEAIIAGALANVLMQPGTGMNLALARDREILHNREMDFLKASALLGQSGRPRAFGSNFIGRPGNRYSAPRWY